MNTQTNSVLLELPIDTRTACTIGLTAATIYAYIKNHALMECFGELRISITEINHDLCFLTRKQIADNISILLKSDYLKKRTGNDLTAIYSLGDFNPYLKR